MRLSHEKNAELKEPGTDGRALSYSNDMKNVATVPCCDNLIEAHSVDERNGLSLWEHPCRVDSYVSNHRFLLIKWTRALFIF